VRPPYLNRERGREKEKERKRERERERERTAFTRAMTIFFNFLPKISFMNLLLFPMCRAFAFLNQKPYLNKPTQNNKISKGLVRTLFLRTMVTYYLILPLQMKNKPNKRNHGRAGFLLLFFQNLVFKMWRKHEN
jgi:hypothetical protein